MKTLFDAGADEHRRRHAPLAERMRPLQFDDVVGQPEVAGKGSPLRMLVQSGQVPSMILWGPPGCGKTTFAKLIAYVAGVEFIELSAVTSGLADIRTVIQEAERRLSFERKRTILFVDEIHRFHKGQQDAFLPWVEKGSIVLIGATTENPSFELNAALLSRCRVVVLKKLEPSAIEQILLRALQDPERGFGKREIRVPSDVMRELTVIADGDARIALNALELLVQAGTYTLDELRKVLQRTHILYDKNGEEHYNIVSALHKSMRGSDVDAALYWVGRMLEGGEEPLYVARRLIRFASEDVGLADSHALQLAVAGYHACHSIGMPECKIILAHVVAYLARAPKSNAIYEAYRRVSEDIRGLPNEPVPLHLRNAPTPLMKEFGYGTGYQYNPDFSEPVQQEYLPDRLKGRKYLSDLL